MILMKKKYIYIIILYIHFTQSCKYQTGCVERTKKLHPTYRSVPNTLAMVA